MTSAKQQLPREVPPPVPVILGCGEARIPEKLQNIRRIVSKCLQTSPMVLPSVDGVCGPAAQEFPGDSERLKKHHAALTDSVPLRFYSYVLCRLRKSIFKGDRHFGPSQQRLRED
jgi:hypothetical protein